MRAQAKRIRHEEEEESVFVSMTDMTVGFLFIMMILLAFFASQMRDPDAVSQMEYDQIVQERDNWQQVAENRQETIDRLEAELAILRKELGVLKQVDPLEAYLSQVAQARRQVLTRLRDAIRADFPNLQVELSEESDALRFQGEGLFASGRSDLAPDRRAIVARLAQRLNEVLPCFTLGEASRFDATCNPAFVMIEAVQIEGHTDDVGTDRLNRTLSAARANSTFFAMTHAAEGVIQHLNLKLQPVLSVAAYGPDRPVATNETAEGRATNRRIDLRFIMVTPQDTDGIEVIRAALQNVGAQP